MVKLFSWPVSHITCLGSLKKLSFELELVWILLMTFILIYMVMTEEWQWWCAVFRHDSDGVFMADWMVCANTLILQRSSQYEKWGWLCVSGCENKLNFEGDVESPLYRRRGLQNTAPYQGVVGSHMDGANEMRARSNAVNHTRISMFPQDVMPCFVALSTWFGVIGHLASPEHLLLWRFDFT